VELHDRESVSKFRCIQNVRSRTSVYRNGLKWNVFVALIFEGEGRQQTVAFQSAVEDLVTFIFPGAAKQTPKVASTLVMMTTIDPADR
jgi:hypothetical protein